MVSLSGPSDGDYIGNSYEVRQPRSPVFAHSRKGENGESRKGRFGEQAGHEPPLLTDSLVASSHFAPRIYTGCGQAQRRAAFMPFGILIFPNYFF